MKKPSLNTWIIISIVAGVLFGLLVRGVFQAPPEELGTGGALLVKFVAFLKDFFLRSVDDNQRINKNYKEFYERLLILRREKSGGMEDILLAMATGYDYRKYQKSKPSK